MKNVDLARRALLARACQVPAATLLLFAAGCADKKQIASCADPAQLSDAEKSLRTSLQYADHAPDPTQACSTCAYFQSSDGTAGCGKCVILNGAVAVNGHCTSWTAKK